MIHAPRFRAARLESLEERRLLAAQVFTPADLNIDETTVTFDVVYTTLDDNGVQDDTIRTNGVSLRLHYNAAELTPDLDAIIASTFGDAAVQDTADTANFDADPTTDRYINLLWFDVDGQFPRDTTLPLKLSTIDFDIAGTLDGVPTIELTGSPPPGFDFVSVPLDNRPWQNPIDRFDVDQSGTPEAFDALLIINEISARNVSDPVTSRLEAVPPSGFAPPFYDVNGDGEVSAIDALNVINELSRLNAFSPPSPENMTGNVTGNVTPTIAPSAIDALLTQWMLDQEDDRATRSSPSILLGFSDADQGIADAEDE